jgi:hypothetical protein
VSDVCGSDPGVEGAVALESLWSDHISDSPDEVYDCPPAEAGSEGCDTEGVMLNSGISVFGSSGIEVGALCNSSAARGRCDSLEEEEDVEIDDGLVLEVALLSSSEGIVLSRRVMVVCVDGPVTVNPSSVSIVTSKVDMPPQLRVKRRE